MRCGLARFGRESGGDAKLLRRRRLDTPRTVVYRSASRSAEEVRREENVSTAQQESKAHSRVPRSHEDARRPGGDEAPAGQGPEAHFGDHREEVESVPVLEASRFGFPRDRRLRKRRDFVAVQTGGAKVRTKYFLVLVRKGTGRVGITVTKRTGNAVTRNRLKRLIREFVRQSGWDAGAWVPHDRDVVIIARSAAAGQSYRELAADLERNRQRVAAC
jgi:ribonuclease P protein component